MSGRVWLVGAGPGDPELLTLKAVRALAAADVILIDDLVDRRVLTHARATTRVIAVGKRGGCASTSQDFIERLLLREAHAGREVVRLKGGDPFLFGRGGEELATLRAAGIEVELVPGITSGMAAPMAAGFSPTHRDASPGVIFITGHEKDEQDRIDWARLAATGLTLVIYMGVARAARIEAGLLEGGMAPATPMVAVQSAMRPGQRIAAGPLQGMAAMLTSESIASPAILVIGEVTRAAQLARCTAKEMESDPDFLQAESR
ncbi:MAG: uroporphyrinogen-III C-methyltransferase [Burkholderiaceae bacterium]